MRYSWQIENLKRCYCGIKKYRYSDDIAHKIFGVLYKVNLMHSEVIY